MRREDCPKRHECGAHGHRYTEGQWVRCPCLVLEIQERALGQMFSPNILLTTKLSEKKEKNTLLSGPLESIRRHVGRVLLDMKGKGQTWITMDAYRLIEIFLGEDEELTTQATAVDTDLLIILLGFSDPRNRYLPELILQVLSRRELLRSPTWVVLGLPAETISTKYNQQLFDKLDTFEKVEVR